MKNPFSLIFGQEPMNIVKRYTVIWTLLCESIDKICLHK